MRFGRLSKAIVKFVLTHEGCRGYTLPSDHRCSQCLVTLIVGDRNLECQCMWVFNSLNKISHIDVKVLIVTYISQINDHIRGLVREAKCSKEECYIFLHMLLQKSSIHCKLPEGVLFTQLYNLFLLSDVHIFQHFFMKLCLIFIGGSFNKKN